MADAPLKLAARDPADLEVIAACVQDALVPIGEMAYLPAEQRFVLVLNRFRWDRIDPKRAVEAERPNSRSQTERDAAFWEAGDSGPPYERVHSGLWFERVTAVRTRGIDLHNRDRILELLTIRSEPNAVSLLFAGNAAVRVEVAELRCFLEDFGEAWPTRWRPRHREDDGAGGGP
jgi:DUF2948 family protein